MWLYQIVKNKYGCMNCKCLSIVMVCFSLLLFSCGRNKKLTELVREMQNKEIYLPAIIRPYHHTGKDTVDWTHSANNRIVVYFSSDMCTVCNINKLHEWDKIKKGQDIIYQCGLTRNFSELWDGDEMIVHCNEGYIQTEYY